MNKNIEPTKIGKNNNKNILSNSDSTSKILHFDDNQKQLPCSNQTIPPGATHSSIEILHAPDKSSSFSPKPSFSNENSSTIALSSGCHKEDQNINSSCTTCSEFQEQIFLLKQQINFYKTHWIPRSVGSEPQYSSTSTQTIDEENFPHHTPQVVSNEPKIKDNEQSHIFKEQKNLIKIKQVSDLN
ncbi:hypothetical protein I4U23_031570 [Adineta vaga]|nr:hypothetical protein I4U23_031570 [Adineta vaga]